MAWCEGCKKTGLRKEDVEFCEETLKVLCTGCYCLRHPMWNPVAEVVALPPAPEKLTYEFSFTSQQGFSAKVGIGQAQLGFHMPMQDIVRVFGPKTDPRLT